MAGTPFTLKEVTKEKEALVEKLPPDKLPTKDKHEKEKIEGDKLQSKDSKDTKDNKDQKDQKDKPEKEKQEKEKQEKDGKNESKDNTDKIKHEKEARDHKILGKEHIDKLAVKEQVIEIQPQAKTAEAEAGMPQAAAPQEASVTAQKLPEKTYAEKIHKEKDKFEKIEKHEKFEIKELDKVIHDVKPFEVPVGLPQPGPMSSTVEDRLSALESAVAQLVHFIPENLRPDLSKGALRQEPDAGTQAKPQPAPAGAETPSDKKEGDKKK